MAVFEVMDSAATLPSEGVENKTLHTWDFRVAVCAVGSRNIDTLSDEALVFLLRSAVDRHTVDDLFGELFRRYQPRVTQWCYRVIREPDRVPDLVQEVFLRAFRRLCTYRGNSRFSTWLFVLTRNHCLNALKKRHIEPVEDGERMPDNLPEHVAPDPGNPDAHGSPRHGASLRSWAPSCGDYSPNDAFEPKRRQSVHRECTTKTESSIAQR